MPEMVPNLDREDSRPSLEEVAADIFGPDNPESARRWVEYWRESPQRNLELLQSFQRLVGINLQGKSVLDIGCGTGGMADIVSDRCRLYVGGDYNFHVIQFAQAGRRGGFVQCSATDLPLPAESMDYIFAFDVIEHLVGGYPRQLQFLREIRRVLRPTGLLFLTTPNRWYPYDAHSDLYWHHYFPAWLSDLYLSWRRPAFLREHRTFREIPLLTPRRLQKLLRQSGLRFLHDLPCGLDRKEYLRLFPLRGVMALTGLGWYPHAEFWGIVSRSEQRRRLRHKLRASWDYEYAQSPLLEPIDFESRILFRRGPCSHQLGPGWYWHEGDTRGCRWTTERAVCYLESRNGACAVRASGFSPRGNRLEIWVDGMRVGEHTLSGPGEFEVDYLIPYSYPSGHLFEVELRCSQTFQPDDSADKRRLGVMIFEVALC